MLIICYTETYNKKTRSFFRKFTGRNYENQMNRQLLKPTTKWQ